MAKEIAHTASIRAAAIFRSEEISLFKSAPLIITLSVKNRIITKLTTPTNAVEKKISKLEPRRDRLLKKLPQKIKHFYERCQLSGISTPVCAIRDKSCSGCHMVLLPQLVNELMANPNSHKNCPYCSRILYFPEVEEVVES